MNKLYDYQGTLVSPSKPSTTLKTVKKSILVDSADRDTTKYYTNGEFVVYLPRNYQNVVSIRLKSAEFPPLTKGSAGAGAMTHVYTNGQNISNSTWSSDVAVPNTNFYFILDIEGLNKSDETVVASQRSTYSDNFFAKIPVNLVTQSSTATPTYFIEYNDHSLEENISRYTPAIENLDRLKIKCRLHSQQDKSGFVYWTSDGTYAGNGGNSSANFGLVIELEMLENSFNDFSSFETRLNNNNIGNYGC